MVRLEVIEMSEPGCSALDALRAYAAVSDAGQDHLLSMALRRAFAMVQSYADTALLAGTFRVCADDHEGRVRLYMGGKATEVVDATGVGVTFVQRGDCVQVGTDGYCEVVFTTEVSSADYDRLLPVVLKYATAVYDGKESRELNQILRECL
jgi:hypothetical protein